MGHTTTRTLERYVSNSFGHRLKAVEAMQNRVMGALAGDKEHGCRIWKTAR
jgi:hypothetical protein